MRFFSRSIYYSQTVMDSEWVAAGHAQFVSGLHAFVNTLITGQPMAVEEPSGAENYPWPWVMFLELSLYQFMFNYGVRVFVVMPLARRLMMYTATRPKKVNFKRVEKFSQSTMEMIFYGVYLVIGYRIVSTQPWLWPSKLWWTNQPDNRYISQDVAFFYVAYCARYFQVFIMLFLEVKRKDFTQMQIHHSVTCLLIYLSYSYGFVRVGCVIMVLLDFADVPLHIAKQLVYCKEVAGKQTGFLTWANTADIFFVIFALSFSFTRMGLYPYVVWSVTVELYNEKADPNYTGPVTPQVVLDTLGIQTVVMQSLVWILQFLQAFWFVLLVRAIKNVLMGSELKDTRSDSEASDTEGEKRD